MARLFTINIPFKENCYPAMVSLCQRGHDLSCSVRYLDKKIRNILPGDVLVFTLTEGLKQPKHLQTDVAEELVCKTSEAILNHLKLSNVPN